MRIKRKNRCDIFATVFMSRITFLTVMLIASFLYSDAYMRGSNVIEKNTGKGYTEGLSVVSDSSGFQADFFRRQSLSCTDYVRTLCQNSLFTSLTIATVPPDTIIRDTTKRDSLSSRTIKRSSDSLEAPVKYHADDSTWMDVAHQKVYLLGNAKVEYKDITLAADSIIFDWGKNEVIALGRKDSTGKVQGKPVFSQGEHSYKAERIAYDFKSKKGQITEITTEEGEGFIRSDTVKRMPDEVLFGKNNIYTTCDEEHPHFYITTNKLKVIPNKSIITGPANLVVAGVRTPLLLPFGIFPVSDKRKSGIIFPNYGESDLLGFYLQHGGYYFGISDHFDLALTGDIYSKGSWVVNASSRFISKYRFNGNYSLSFSKFRTFDPAENDYTSAPSFKVILNFNQDPKARPNSNIGASVSFASAGFDKLFGNPQTTDLNGTSTSSYLTNTYTSSIHYSQTIPNSPFNFTISANHSQSTLTHVVNLQLPVFSFSMNTLNPFKRKESIGKPKWYERISMSYTMNAKNQLNTLDTLLFHESPLNKTMAGVEQFVPVNAPFSVFKYLTVNPGFNYTETWALQTISKRWDTDSFRVVNDTIRRFAAARDFSLNVGTSTRIYGMIQFKHGKIKAIRHVFNPSLNYSYHPDFSEPQWNAYKTVQVDSPGIFQRGEVQRYSIFSGGIYGGPPAGKYSGISLALNNNLEMKVVSKKDTVTGTKKIKLLDAFNIAANYNFAVDTLQLSPVTMSGRTTLFDKININFGANFDPYIADTFGRRLNVFVWDADHKLARLTSANIGLSAQFNSPKKSTVDKLTQAQADYLIYSGNTYEDISIPWSISTGYNLNISKVKSIHGSDSTLFTQTLAISGSLNITRNWRISGSTSYDFVHHEFPTASIQIYRDLHCWELSMDWIPFGIRQSYTFTLRVKAGVLQDLKLHKQQGWYQY